MPEYAKIERQNVLLGEGILFDAVIPCRSGHVLHENGTAVFLLRGISNKCYARYVLEFTGNIAIPEDGAAGEPIAIAISVNGEAKQTSRAVVTPTVVENYFNVSSTAIIDVPRGAMFSVTVRAVSGVTVGETGTPAPSIDVQNAKLDINQSA